MNEEHKAQALARTAGLLGRDDDASRHVLAQLWDAAFEEGRVDALGELQDRFCVCMKLPASPYVDRETCGSVLPVLAVLARIGLVLAGIGRPCLFPDEFLVGALWL
jgi:hypothetical protein